MYTIMISKENLEGVLNALDEWVSFTRATLHSLRVMYKVKGDYLLFQLVPNQKRVVKYLAYDRTMHYNKDLEKCFKVAYKQVQKQKGISAGNLNALANEVETRLRYNRYKTLIAE